LIGVWQGSSNPIRALGLLQLAAAAPSVRLGSTVQQQHNRRSPADDLAELLGAMLAYRPQPWARPCPRPPYLPHTLTARCQGFGGWCGARSPRGWLRHRPRLPSLPAPTDSSDPIAALPAVVAALQPQAPSAEPLEVTRGLAEVAEQGAWLSNAEVAELLAKGRLRFKTWR
jgi:hypothetical protein